MMGLKFFAKGSRSFAMPLLGLALIGLQSTVPPNMWAGETIIIRVFETVEVEGDQVHLADIADIKCPSRIKSEKIGAFIIGKAPLPGKTRRIEQDYIKFCLKRNGIDIKKCSIPIHHYGRLDKEKLDRKGEIYFDIGQKKLSETGDDLNALRELATQATILERNREALDLWQRLLAAKPFPELAAIAHINIGTIYSRLEKFEDALDAGQKAVEYGPNLKEARYNLAMAQLHCGNAQQTIVILEDLLNVFPDYPPARFILSAAYCCTGRKRKGLESIRNLLDSPMGRHLVFPCVELGQSLVAARQIQYALWVLGAAIECDIINKDLLDLFNECIKMNNDTRKLSDIPPIMATDRPAFQFENLPR